MTGKAWNWICEYCFDTEESAILPDDWSLVWGCAVCPVCQKLVHQDGGTYVVPGGAYAGDKADPRLIATQPPTRARLRGRHTIR